MLIYYLAYTANYIGCKPLVYIRGNEKLKQIAQQGRQWALQHYSPKAVAQRFLTEVAAKIRS